MIAFAMTCRQIAQTPAKNEKVAVLAAYLRELTDADLAAATRFFTGNPFAQREERTLAVGGRTIVTAAHNVWGAGEEALRAGYRATGDLGSALGPLVRPAVDLGLFARDTLTPAILKTLLDDMADASGKSAGRTRLVLCERILASCTDPLEATYVIKIMTGELRIGLREGLVLDAIAAAFERTPAAVRRAASLAGDDGEVALAAKHDRLTDVTIAYHAPVAFMLASPVPYGSDYKELATGSWLVEDKYDGVRISAHVTPERISLFSRTLNDVAAAFPEIVEALRALPGSFILDGEIVAERDGRVLPFRFLQTRLQRKRASSALIAEIPTRYVAFDALAHGDAILLDERLEKRRDALADILASTSDRIELAPWTTLESPSSVDDVHARFEVSRLRGNEGLVFKRTDSPYTPGRRGKAWLKLKRELATLDCVVVAVERGHGKRVNMLSDYTFAVRADDRLVVIGKAYSGLTDLEIVQMTAWFEAHRLPTEEARNAYERLELKRHEIPVEPEIVVEIAFDIIQQSDLHASGFSLRFPRIVRLRSDKRPTEADTIERVQEIHVEMLDREGIKTD
jgi:DNA ligase-1